MGAYIGRRAPWADDPPAWEIAGLIPVERVVTRSPDIAITVGPMRVHTTGVVLPFTVRFVKVVTRTTPMSFIESSWDGLLPTGTR